MAQEFNEAGQLIKTTTDDGQWREYTYHESGLLIRTQRSTGIDTIYHHVGGLNIKIEHSDGRWETFEYNSKGECIFGKSHDYMTVMTNDEPERRWYTKYLVYDPDDNIAPIIAHIDALY